MKGIKISCLLCAFGLSLALVGCGVNPYAVDGGVSLPEHRHDAPLGDNVIAHEPEGYCGNTITTVRCERSGAQEECWQNSFWGGASVGVTDFLRWLDYSEEVCRCLPEYYVSTEFSRSEYGINLTEGYVRYEGKQCQLTEEQRVWLAETFAEIKAGAGKDICALPPAEEPSIEE